MNQARSYSFPQHQPSQAWPVSLSAVADRLAALFHAEREQRDEALRWAAWRGQTQAVRALLAAGADVHANDDEALRLASARGHHETVEVLLAAGANIHAKDGEAMRLASRGTHKATMDALRAAGAKDAPAPFQDWFSLAA